MGSSRRNLPNIVLHCIEGPGGGGDLNYPYLGNFLSNGANFFFQMVLVLTIFLGSGEICKKNLHPDVSRGLRSQKTPILSHFTREFGQKLRAIALGGPTTPKSKISLQIIYKCTKPLITSVKFRGHRTFFSWFFCNKKVAFLTSCWRSIYQSKLD